MDVKVWGIRRDMPAPLSTDQMRARVFSAIEFALGRWQTNPDLSTQQLLEQLPPQISGLSGGETRCIEITSGSDRLIVDMGTGARRLGYEIMAKGVKGEFHLILTASTWDRLQGWPFFIPGYIPGNVFKIYTTMKDAEERLMRQQDFSFFPVRFHEMASQKTFETLTENGVQINSFHVRALAGRRADLLRIESAGRVLVIGPPGESQPLLSGASLWLVTDAHKAVELEKEAAGVPYRILDRRPEDEDADFDSLALAELQTIAV